MGECPVDPMRMRFDSIMKLDQKSKVKSSGATAPTEACIEGSGDGGRGSGSGDTKAKRPELEA